MLQRRLFVLKITEHVPQRLVIRISEGAAQVVAVVLFIAVNCKAVLVLLLARLLGGTVNLAVVL
jgi:hypothetical protein